MVEIFTGSWRANINPERYSLISISRSAPRGRSGYRRYTALCPGVWFRDTADVKAWTERYEREILGVLDAREVVADLERLANGRPAVLLCWEPPPPNANWCHRGHVSSWLHDELGLVVPELGHESLGYGARHPKLPSTGFVED